jgi:hypothetical protein
VPSSAADAAGGAIMAEDWAADVKKWVPAADDAAIKGIVKYCGIALQKKDSSMVSCSDKTERDRVRDNFLKKKLALADADADLDKAVMEVCQKLGSDKTKNRVTFYYLLAEKYGKLSMFA